MTTGQRRLIFQLCRGLQIDDDTRRVMAGGFRKDKQETTKGMDVREAGLMIMFLKDKWRELRLKQRKRIDPGDERYASDRWRHRVAGQAKALWGERWEVELHEVIKRHNNGVYMFWYDERIPKGLWYRVSEEMKARVARAV